TVAQGTRRRRSTIVGKFLQKRVGSRDTSGDDIVGRTIPTIFRKLKVMTTRITARPSELMPLPLESRSVVTKNRIGKIYGIVAADKDRPCKVVGAVIGKSEVVGCIISTIPIARKGNSTPQTTSIFQHLICTECTVFDNTDTINNYPKSTTLTTCFIADKTAIG